MRGYFECDPKVLAESNALANCAIGARVAPAKPAKVYDLAAEYGQSDAAVAAELDSILAGYGYGKAERLVISDRGGAVECETLDNWVEQ